MDQRGKGFLNENDKEERRASQQEYVKKLIAENDKKGWNRAAPKGERKEGSSVFSLRQSTDSPPAKASPPFSRKHAVMDRDTSFPTPPPLAAQNSEDNWMKDELQKWQDERKKVGSAWKKIHDENQKAQDEETESGSTPPSTGSPSGTSSSPSKSGNRLDALKAGGNIKRRTIGVGTPHSHFFKDDLAQVRTQINQLESRPVEAGAPQGSAPQHIENDGGEKNTPPKTSSSSSSSSASSSPAFSFQLNPPPPSPDAGKYDYTTDASRTVPDVPYPEGNRLTEAELFDSNGKVDIPKLRQHFLREGRLDFGAARTLLEKVGEILRAEPNLLTVEAPCAVVGDIHGQFYDLVYLIDKAGNPETSQYLFLGDYVDRGCFGSEVCFYLFALKINFPKQIWMLRGNHESRLLAAHFNFKLECLHKYDDEIYAQIQDVFDALPLCALLSADVGRFFCVHGGLSPEVRVLEDVNEIYRFREPPDKGAFCDLLWSDPIEETGAIGLTGASLARWHARSFEQNPTRGCSYIYGHGAVKEFLERNNLLCVVRAHEVQKQGYRLHKFRRGDIEHPMVMTIFSAPNYCDMYENWAAWLFVDHDSYSFGQTAWSEHPYYLPKFSNAITFTLPFVAENFMKVLADLLTAIGEIGHDEDRDDDTATDKRVRAMGRIAIMMKKMRLDQENNIRSIQGDNKFEEALRMDEKNEKRPIVVYKRTKTM